MTLSTATRLTLALLLAAPHAQAQRPAPPATTLYAVTPDGALKWYRHTGALTAGGLNDPGAWDARGGKEIGVGWNDSAGVFTGGDGVIYTIFPNGDLYWYRHDGYRTGLGLNDPGGWSAASRKKVGVGWNGFKQVFATDDGVIYAVRPDGSLRWYRHAAFRTGGGLNDPGAWDPRSGREVGVGWNGFVKVFAAPGGVIYGVLPGGDLKWYRHLGYHVGGGLNDPGAWDARSGKVVGTGWNGFTGLLAGSGGLIYGTLPGGSLRWYRHLGYRTGGGLNDAGAWDARGGKEIGVGWNFTSLFGF